LTGVTTQLPLFPLPLVLFPGTRLPLHIFEPRYRQLLTDVLTEGTAREFGVLYRADAAAEQAIPMGHIGCIAVVEQSERLSDGRANVLVRGRLRFRYDGLVPTDRLYHVAATSAYDDVPELPASLAPMVADVLDLFQRVAAAARSLADDADSPPELPDDAGHLAFAIAAMIDMDAPARQRLLVSRSPSSRLRDVAEILSGAVDALEHRAVVHARSKHNGHGPDVAAPPPSAP
jgi:Lon protease-like protein